MSVKFRKYHTTPIVLFLFLLFFLICLIGGIYHRLQPVLLEYASSALYQRSYYAANEVIRKTVDEKGLLYHDLVTLEKNGDGEVIAMHTDIGQLNAIKTETLAELLTILRSDEESVIHVPIGNLTGNLFLSGRGPRIPIKTIPVTTIEAEYQNRFTESGINQTRHELMIHIKIHTGMLYPSETIDKTIELEICLAETILLGNVPQFYAGIE